jgi:hypothetical protein
MSDGVDDDIVGDVDIDIAPSHVKWGIIIRRDNPRIRRSAFQAPKNAVLSCRITLTMIHVPFQTPCHAAMQLVQLGER